MAKLLDNVLRLTHHLPPPLPPQTLAARVQYEDGGQQPAGG